MCRTSFRTSFPRRFAVGNKRVSLNTAAPWLPYALPLLREALREAEGNTHPFHTAQVAVFLS